MNNNKPNNPPLPEKTIDTALQPESGDIFGEAIREVKKESQEAMQAIDSVFEQAQQNGLDEQGVAEAIDAKHIAETEIAASDKESTTEIAASANELAEQTPADENERAKEEKSSAAVDALLKSEWRNRKGIEEALEEINDYAQSLLKVGNDRKGNLLKEFAEKLYIGTLSFDEAIDEFDKVTPYLTEEQWEKMMTIFYGEKPSEDDFLDYKTRLLKTQGNPIGRVLDNGWSKEAMSILDNFAKNPDKKTILTQLPDHILNRVFTFREAADIIDALDADTQAPSFESKEEILSRLSELIFNNEPGTNKFTLLRQLKDEISHSESDTDIHALLRAAASLGLLHNLPGHPTEVIPLPIKNKDEEKKAQESEVLSTTEDSEFDAIWNEWQKKSTEDSPEGADAQRKIAWFENFARLPNPTEEELKAALLSANHQGIINKEEFEIIAKQTLLDSAAGWLAQLAIERDGGLGGEVIAEKLSEPPQPEIVLDSTLTQQNKAAEPVVVTAGAQTPKINADLNPSKAERLASYAQNAKKSADTFMKEAGLAPSAEARNLSASAEVRDAAQELGTPYFTEIAADLGISEELLREFLLAHLAKFGEKKPNDERMDLAAERFENEVKKSTDLQKILEGQTDNPELEKRIYRALLLARTANRPKPGMPEPIILNQTPQNKIEIEQKIGSAKLIENMDSGDVGDVKIFPQHPTEIVGDTQHTISEEAAPQPQINNQGTEEVPAAENQKSETTDDLTPPENTSLQDIEKNKQTNSQEFLNKSREWMVLGDRLIPELRKSLGITVEEEQKIREVITSDNPDNIDLVSSLRKDIESAAEKVISPNDPDRLRKAKELADDYWIKLQMEEVYRANRAIAIREFAERERERIDKLPNKEKQTSEDIIRKSLYEEWVIAEQQRINEARALKLSQNRDGSENPQKASLIKKILTGALYGYQKMDWKYRVALGAVIGGIAVGTVVGGGAIVTGAEIGRRLLRGMVGASAARTTGKAFDWLENKYNQRQINRLIIDSDADVESFINSLPKSEQEYARELVAAAQRHQKNLKYKAIVPAIIGGAAAYGTGVTLSHTTDFFAGGGKTTHVPDSSRSIHHSAIQEKISSQPSIDTPPKISAQNTQHIAENPVAPKLESSAASPSSFIETARPGDSIWRMTERQLSNSNDFKTMSAEQRTYVIDALRRKIEANPAAFGLKNGTHIQPGDTIDLSKLVADKDTMSAIFEKARHLSPTQIESIHQSNLEQLRAFREKFISANEQPQIRMVDPGPTKFEIETGQAEIPESSIAEDPSHVYAPDDSDLEKIANQNHDSTLNQPQELVPPEKPATPPPPELLQDSSPVDSPRIEMDQLLASQRTRLSELIMQGVPQQAALPVDYLGLNGQEYLSLQNIKLADLTEMPDEKQLLAMANAGRDIGKELTEGRLKISVRNFATGKIQELTLNEKNIALISKLREMAAQKLVDQNATIGQITETNLDALARTKPETLKAWRAAADSLRRMLQSKQ